MHTFSDRSARPCGCDEAAQHICAGHASAPWGRLTLGHQGKDVLAVEGPDATGGYTIIAGMTLTRLSRFNAERLAHALHTLLRHRGDTD